MKKSVLKKVISLVVVLSFVVTLYSFSLPGKFQSLYKTQSAMAQSAKTKSKKKFKIGLSFPAADHGWLAAVITYAKQQAKELGLDYILTTADNPNKQTNDVEDLIAQKVDAIVILPIESDPMAPVAKKVKKAGIPLIVFDRELNTQDVTITIRGDNKGIGLNAGEYIASVLRGKGNVVEITGVPSSVTTLRSQGFREAIKKYPGIKIIASQSGMFQKEKSLTVMENILQAHPHIDAVYTQDDEMALGVLQAIKEAKRTDIKVITGAGGAKEAYKLIKEDKTPFKATFTYSPLMVKEAVKWAYKILNGEKVKQKVITLPAQQVDKTNVDKFYNPNAPY